MIIEGLKENTLGVFKRKVLEAGIHLKQTKLESPWKMAAERGTHELKRGSDRIMTKMKSPKVLWDYFLELEAYIQSNTALSIFELVGMTPETKMSGKTSDITSFCEFGWYQWVYFRDTSVTFLG